MTNTDVANAISLIELDIKHCLEKHGINKAKTVGTPQLYEQIYSAKKGTFSFSKVYVKIYYQFSQAYGDTSLNLHRINLVVPPSFYEKFPKPEDAGPVRTAILTILLRRFPDAHDKIRITPTKLTDIPSI